MKSKQNKPDLTNEDGFLPEIPEEMRKETGGFKAPAGYFDSLSPRIIDRINSKEQSSISNVLISVFKKPLVWVPVMATLLVIVSLVFLIPSQKETPVIVVNEISDISMAYDPSYAQEAILLESHTLETRLENSNIDYTQTSILNGQNGPSAEEIIKYLKDNDVDTELLNEY